MMLFGEVDGDSPVLDLSVFQGNEQAIRFCESHDFIVVKKADGMGDEERMPDAQYRWAAKQDGSRSYQVQGQ